MKKTMLAVMVCALLVLVPAAFAAIENAAVVNGTSDSTVISNSLGNVTIYGGNVTEVNVTTQSITQSWAGFYGQVSGGVVLGDSSGNSFYEWTLTDVTGAIVYATNDTTSFGAVAAATPGDFPSYLTSSASDNFTNTFNETTVSWTGSSTLGAIANVDYVQTLNSTGQNVFRTYALQDSTDGAYILAGEAQNDVDSFANSNVDFQILAPANTAGQIYYFYLELP